MWKKKTFQWKVIFINECKLKEKSTEKIGIKIEIEIDKGLDFTDAIGKCF